MQGASCQIALPALTLHQGIRTLPLGGGGGGGVLLEVETLLLFISRVMRTSSPAVSEAKDSLLIGLL